MWIYKNCLLKETNYVFSFKGTVLRDFYPPFFSPKVTHMGTLIDMLKYFQICVRFRGNTVYIFVLKD